MFSLPHHRESFTSHPMLSITPDDKKLCVPTLDGPACLTQGSDWILKDNLIGEPSFLEPRRPMAEFISHLAKAVNKDIHFRVPDYYSAGAGDTYFSGKYLAELARILLITEELMDMCSEVDDNSDKVYKECNNITLPSNEDFDRALHHLRSSTEVWIDGTADIPFVYDTRGVEQ